MKITKHDPCGHCGGTVRRREGERSNHFRERKYCSDNCYMLSKAGRRKPIPEHPPCEMCGGEVQIYDNERPSHYLDRKCCSPECVKISHAVSAANQAGTLEEIMHDYDEPYKELEPWPIHRFTSLRFKDVGLVRSYLSSAINYSLVGCSSAMLAEEI